MKKQMKRLGALLAAIMMLFAVSVPAMAEDNDAITSVDMNKTLVVGEEVNAPTDTFVFTVTPGTDLAAPTGGSNYDGLEIMAGVSGGLSAPANITSADAAATDGKSESMAIDASVFTKPGIYRYMVSETAGSVKGMKYDDSKYTVDLYVEYNSNGELQVSNVIVIDEDGTKVGDSNTDNADIDGFKFTNTFAADDPDDDDDDDDALLHNVTVEKSVTGNQGDKTKEFTFTVTYTTENSRVLKYKKDSGNWTDIASGSTITLKDGESFVLGGLAEDDTYQIVETQESGYKGKVTGDVTVSEQSAGTNVDTTSQTMGTDHVSMTFENNKAGTIPTGIFTNYKPFWIMGILAVALIAVFARKRNDRFADEL